MTYKKRYEDSYLDDEQEEFTGVDLAEAHAIIELLRAPVRDEDDEAMIIKLTNRIFGGARMPGVPGERAVESIALIGDEYKRLGRDDVRVELWARLAELAEGLGNKELYYLATDKMAE